MIDPVSIALICAAMLLWQYREHRHAANLGRITKLEAQVIALENKRADTFNPATFKELESKVEALRIAQNLRGTLGR